MRRARNSTISPILRLRKLRPRKKRRKPMPRDILSEYGPESSQPQKPRATSGGVMSTRDVNNYRPPQGPTNINDPKGPGLHGDNHGNSQSCTPGRGTGSVGLGGTNRGTSGGAQGRH